MAEILEEELPQILLFTTINADAYSARLSGFRRTSTMWSPGTWLTGPSISNPTAPER